MPTTANTINYYVAADGTLRDGPQGSIPQQPRINYGTEYAVTLSFPPSTIAEGDQLQVAVNRTRTFFSSASATGDAPVAAVAKHDVTAEEAAAQTVEVVLSTNTRAMIDQVNGIDHPVRGFFGVHVLRGQSFISLAVADAFMLSVESGPDAISPSLPVVDYPTREEAEALADRSEAAAERAEQAAAGIVPPLQLDAPPTTSTAGSVGQLATWHDPNAADQSKADHIYHLVFISTSDSATLYHWEECVLVSMGNVAGGYPVLDVNGLVPSSKLPWATAENGGVVRTGTNVGTVIVGGERVAIYAALTNNIDAKSSNYLPIVPSYLDYAVRSVLPLVTEIPAATSDYSLVDSSATTLNHSHTFVHTPTQAPTYRLPQVTDTTVSHYIELTVDFTNVQTYSFLDANGDALVPLFTPSIAVGDVYTFKMEYSAIKAKWLIYPQKQGAVADDFVMRGEVGAANGVAGLDSNAVVPQNQLPIPNQYGGTYGVVKYTANYGIRFYNGSPYLYTAPNSAIDSRAAQNQNGYGAITPASINYAVTAALTDSNRISLTDAQKAAAQEVFGVGGDLTGTGAPTTSTVGKVMDRYLDTATGKTYTCTAVNVDDTDPQNPATTYTWVDDINANGGNIKNNFSLRFKLGNIDYNLLKLFGDSVGYSASIGGTANASSTIGQVYSLSLTANNALRLYSYAGNISFNGHAKNTAGGFAILETNGTIKTPNGFASDVTVIPAATTAYTLVEGVQSHTPESASVYTLPAVTDATRTHECILTIKFSSTVLTYEFQDSAGNTLVPLPLNGDIEDGSVVSFLCRYESLLSQWVIYPVMDGKEAE